MPTKRASPLPFIPRHSTDAAAPSSSSMRPGEIATNSSTGEIYVKTDSSLVAVSGGGGGDSSDKLPLSGGTMTGAILFGSGGQNISVGSFDNSTGGANGIALVCAVGYELNWQGGHLSNTYSSTNYAILCDSSLTLAAGKQITFGDGTYLTSKLPVIVDDATASGTMATNAATCDIVDCEFSGTAMIGNPTNSADGQTILWRISRTGGAQTVTLDSDFVIVSGTIDNTENMVTFVRATYSVAAGEKWYADIANVELTPSAAVSIFLRMDGADASTTFTDHSANALTVTANGGTTISTSQGVSGGSSAYFTGNPVSYLTTDDSPLFGFGTGDFAIEMWVQLVAGSGRYGALSIGDYTNGILWRMAPVGGQLFFAGTLLNWFTANPAGVPIDGAWHHVAVTRQGTMARGFLDGGLDFETDVGVIDLGASRVLMIGCGSHELNDYEAFSGYIDNVKITKGEAVYTAAFTPEIVTLSLHMGGADASTTFTDSSPFARTVTPSGTAAISTAQGAIGGSSALFNGVGDYLTIDGNWTGWDTTDYTIEFWMRPNQVNGYFPIMTCPGGFNIHLYTSGDINVNDGATGSSIGGGTAIVAGTWTHVAVVRLSGTISLYQNGVLVSTTTQTPGAGGSTLTIGGTAGVFYDGYLDEVKITKGEAVYTAAFTPSRASLLLHMNASPFVDSSPIGRVITVNGGVTLGAPKYGAGSCAFDGGTSCLSMTMDDMNWEMDWTIEFWMNATVASGAGTPIAIGNLNNGVGGIHCCLADNQLMWSDGITAFLQGGVVVTGVWTHVAMVRLSGVNYFYQDGVQIGTGERTFPVVDLVATIGSAPNYGLGFIGTLDDVRIVKGQALYSGSNFTPPAGPLV